MKLETIEKSDFFSNRLFGIQWFLKYFIADIRGLYAMCNGYLFKQSYIWKIHV